MTDQTDVVAEIVRDALGEAPTTVEHVRTLEESDVFRIHLSSGVVFFKAEHEGHSIAIAAWAYMTAATVGVPVPDVRHLDLTCDRWPKEFALITAVEGSDLEHDPLEGTELIEAIEGYGELLRRLHTVRLRGFGDLEFVEGSADPVGCVPDHAASVGVSWGLPYLVGEGLVTKEDAARIEKVVARHEELFRTDQGVLIHGDAGLDHIFVEREKLRITGLIDFEPWSADPVVDLAIFAYHYPDLAPHLIDGYGSTTDDLDVRLELYGLVRAVGSARWEHELGFNIDSSLSEMGRRTAHLEGLLG